MGTVRGYGAESAESPIAPLTFTRREPGPTDVEVQILYCGICHTDV
ncbi:MAG: NAD(P)-dependent alcohol dehydrogenase, partial [Pseudomonadota bacterium]|nr:NAD(P)-dependent alcohol dehydrogenase [Pseudomonadota bacterium]